MATSSLSNDLVIQTLINKITDLKNTEKQTELSDSRSLKLESPTLNEAPLEEEPSLDLNTVDFNSIKDEWLKQIQQIKTSNYEKPLLEVANQNQVENNEFQNFHKDLKNIQTKYQETLEKLNSNHKLINDSEDGLVAKYQTTHSNLAKLNETIQSRTYLIQELKSIKPILELKLSIDKMIKANQLKESAKSLNQLILDLDNLNDAQKSYHIIESIENWENFTREELVKQLVSKYFELVKLHSKAQIESSTDLAQISIHDIQESHELIKLIDSLGSLHLILSPLHSFILNSWFIPFLRHPSYHRLTQTDINQKNGIQLAISPKDDCAQNVEEKLNEFIKLTSAISSYLIPSPIPLSSWFTDVYHNNLVSIIIEKIIYRSVPKNVHHLDKMIELETSIRNFEHKLIESNFLTSEDTVLIAKLDPPNALFIENKLEESLHMVRQLILYSDLDSIQVYEPDLDAETTFDHANFLKHVDDRVKLLRYNHPDLDQTLNEIQIKNFPSFPVCLIPNTGATLLEIIKQLMLEICQAPDNCKKGLINIVCDIVQLYISLAPVRIAMNQEEPEKFIALLHNESSYIAHHLCTLPYQLNLDNNHPEWFQSSKYELNNLCNSLWILAKQGLSDYFERIKEQIGRSLQDIGTWENLEYKKKANQVKTSLSEVIDLISPLKSNFKEILPNTVFYGIVGWLINFIISQIDEGILALTDISADESLIVKDLLLPLTKLVESIYNKSSVNLYLPTFKRFDSLVKIMDCNLDQIFYLFSDEELWEEFTYKEIMDLIRALFSQSDKRESVIKSIKEYY